MVPNLFECHDSIMVPLSEVNRTNENLLKYFFDGFVKDFFTTLVRSR